jgi:hypothetical protein
MSRFVVDWRSFGRGCHRPLGRLPAHECLSSAEGGRFATKAGAFRFASQPECGGSLPLTTRSGRDDPCQDDHVRHHLVTQWAEDYSGQYGRDLSRFVGGVRRAWFRDPYSAYVAQTFRHTPNSCQGVDATMLLPAPTSPGNAKAGMQVFVGRSNLKPEWVGTFGSQLAAGLSLRPSWLPWGEAPTS